MIDKVYIIDDFLPENYQELIKDTIFDTYNHPWYLKKSLSENTENYSRYDFVDAPGLANVFYNRLGVNNEITYNRFIPICHLACEKINFEFSKILYGRSFFQFPTTTHEGMTNPHVDTVEDHLVCLYYVIDSDGETVILNKEDFPAGSPAPDWKEYEIVHRIEPKQGRALLFNGRIYHANYLPKENMRCVINFNIC